MKESLFRWKEFYIQSPWKGDNLPISNLLHIVISDEETIKYIQLKEILVDSLLKMYFIKSLSVK